MNILYLILVLVVVGVVLYLINKYIPMEPVIKRILNIAVILVLVIWLLKIMGIWDFLASARI